MKLSTLYNRVFSIRPWITDDTTSTQICKLLKQAFGSRSIIQFDTDRWSYGVLNFLDDDKPQIVIMVPSTSADVDTTLFRVFETLAHEYVHLQQQKKAKGCPRRYKEDHAVLAYYGCNTEIDAFGMSAALERQFNMEEEIARQYRCCFKQDDPRYKRFLKKRWKHSLAIESQINSGQLGKYHARSENTATH